MGIGNWLKKKWNNLSKKAAFIFSLETSFTKNWILGEEDGVVIQNTAMLWTPNYSLRDAPSILKQGHLISYLSSSQLKCNKACHPLPPSPKWGTHDSQRCLAEAGVYRDSWTNDICHPWSRNSVWAALCFCITRDCRLGKRALHRYPLPLLTLPLSPSGESCNENRYRGCCKESPTIMHLPAGWINCLVLLRTE